MIAIRLSKLGRKKAPFYRIVAVDSRKKNAGEVSEILGTWNPAKKDLNVDTNKVNEWIKVGGQMSATVKKLIENNKK